MAKTAAPFSNRSFAQPAARITERSKLSRAYVLSTLLVVVTLIASAAGFFITDLFQRDNAALAGCARGTALVILIVAVPGLILSMLLSARGSLRARLVWTGTLVYIAYNAGYFTFSATFNRFFLVFVAMLSLAVWSLVVLLVTIDIQDVKAAFSPQTRVRLFSIFLVIPVLLFFLTDFLPSIAAMATNSLPVSILDTQLPTNHFHVMDLAFLVPAFLMAAVWLWQRQAWGYTLTGMMLTYYTIELLGIASDQWFGGRAAPRSPLADASAAPAFLIGSLITLAVTLMFLGSWVEIKNRIPS